MQTRVITVRPKTSTREALALMREHRISCLPVVNSRGRLLGIVTERDFMRIAAPLLDSFLAGNGAEEADEAVEAAAEEPVAGRREAGG